MAESGADLRVNARLKEAGLDPLDSKAAAQFDAYLSLFVRWNQRLNLSSIRDEDQILSRHFIESIGVARFLPAGIRTLLDLGSGAGLPGIPIALCRSEIAVTLAESQGKKAAFLREVVRTLAIQVKVFANRAETLNEVFDCVILRAVDNMPKAVSVAARLVAPAGWLALMTTISNLGVLRDAAGSEFAWTMQRQLPGSAERIVTFASRQR
jgi:16S rRNA (guanine527-N7)-methyltransferase